ncbi:ribosome recycling factor [Parcubacteria bacterium DG_74_2]|nr:MAG: ribosome recycling factor [Parcubacteria bacterium DG_74_2]
MEYKEILNKIRPELEKAINFLERELGKIRTSRASTSIIEDIEVDCFGQKFPLKQLALISTPERRQILIQPWDQSYIEGISKALESSNLGISPIVDKNLIRLNLPPLSEEYRKNLLKIVSERKEQTKRTIRHWRGVAWDEIQEKFREGKIREDAKFKAKDELQDLIDEYNEKTEEMVEKKKKEVIE